MLKRGVFLLLFKTTESLHLLSLHAMRALSSVVAELKHALSALYDVVAVVE